MGGTTHLVHIIKERARHPADPRDIFSTTGATPSDEEAIAMQKLLELIPEDDKVHAIKTETHVLIATDTAEAICQAAERLDTTIVCLGAHGRSGVSKALLGSVAQAVVQNTRRPVLLAHLPLA